MSEDENSQRPRRSQGVEEAALTSQQEKEAARAEEGSRWQRVSSPESADRPTGVPTSPIPGRRRRPARALDDHREARNRRLKIAAVVSLAVVMIALVISYLGTRAAPTVVETPTPKPTPATWPLALPPNISGYSRDANDGVKPTKGQDGATVLSAKYARAGKPMALVMITRSYTDLKSFAESSNINNAAPVKDAMCGTSGDVDGLGACAVMMNDTVVVVFDLSEMTTDEQITLAHQVMNYAASKK